VRVRKRRKRTHQCLTLMKTQPIMPSALSSNRLGRARMLFMPRGDTSSTSTLPRRTCWIQTVMVTCSSLSTLAPSRSLAVTSIVAVVPAAVMSWPALASALLALATGLVHHAWGLTSSQRLASSTMAYASSLPNPYLWLYGRPEAVICQSGSVGLIWTAVRTHRCCMSRHVRSGRASRTRAKMPAAMGAAADVPP